MADADSLLAAIAAQGEKVKAAKSDKTRSAADNKPLIDELLRLKAECVVPSFDLLPYDALPRPMLCALWGTCTHREQTCSGGGGGGEQQQHSRHDVNDNICCLCV